MNEVKHYHITLWGQDQIPVYNCNFCPYDTLSIDTIDQHINETHYIDPRTGERYGLKGVQYVPEVEQPKEVIRTTSTAKVEKSEGN